MNIFQRLLDDAKSGQLVEGPIKAIHQWTDMSQRQVVLEDGTKTRTCSAALGYSFAAGTADGGGFKFFKQGTSSSNPLMDMVSGVLSTPTEEDEACHAPKPILLNTGKMSFPYQWHPKDIDTQILCIGNILIVALPGEFTTMAGR